jgi:ribosomal protein S18 acetylase RimI-like enzyme
MRLDDTAHLPPIQPVELRRFNLPRTIRLFCQLYAESFAGLPWFQPYSENEVAATLAEPEDIIFLFLGGLPIGFVWTRHSDEGFGEIEPLGIVKPYQGEGHGRALLIAALHELARRGARRVTIGAWRDNQRAVRLYESLGFRQARIFTYLALNLR